MVMFLNMKFGEVADPISLLIILLDGIYFG